MSDRVISSTGSYTGYNAATTIDAASDFMLIQQGSVYKKISRNVLMGLTGTPADLSTVQTFTNKVIGSTNTITSLDTLFTLQDNSDPTKQAQFQLSGITTATTRTYTLPNASSTLVDLSSSQTLTNKTLTSPSITGGTLANSTITVDAISEFSAANGVTVDGLNIKDGKLNTNNSVVTNNITDTAVTPAKLQAGTGASWGWSTWTPTFVNLSGGTLTVSKYIQIGKTVFYAWVYTLTGTNVSGSVTFTLPVTAGSTYATNLLTIGNVNYIDQGSSRYLGVVWIDSSTTGRLYVGQSGGTYLVENQISATVPFTFDSTDTILASGFYEAA